MCIYELIHLPELFSVLKNKYPNRTWGQNRANKTQQGVHRFTGTTV